MRSRTLLLAIAAALLVAAAPAQAHGGHHGNGHHKRHKPRAVDVQLLSINDFHGNLAPPGTLTLPGGVRTPAAGERAYRGRGAGLARPGADSR